jgi:hypothetical protein
MSLPDSSVSAIDDGPFRFVPCLKLRHETLLSSSLDKMRKPHLVAVMDLGFDYRGVLVRAGERPTAERDIAGERRTRFLWNDWVRSRWIALTAWQGGWSPTRTT